MKKVTTQLASPDSTGGRGYNFETCIQAHFALLMLTGGFAPCLPAWSIEKIKLQGKYAGFNTDDLIIFVGHPDGDKKAKLLSQIRLSVKITKNDQKFGKVILDAWRDFQNPKFFTIGLDAFALITGPLTVTDTKNARIILERARHAEDAADFLRQIELANFSSNSQRAKLKVFQAHLKKANGGSDLSDDQLWKFLKSFHLLGYDLDIKTGITHSLLHSLIGQYSPENVQALWSRVVDEIQFTNQNAGTITLETFSEDIRKKFKRRAVETIPDGLIRKKDSTETFSWSEVQHASELVIAALLGAWDENSAADKTAGEQLANEDFTVWIKKIREILQHPKKPLLLKNGIWSVKNKLEMWNTLESRFFDEHLDRFKEIAVHVLKEQDPMFELPPEEHYAASIHGKYLAHSHQLRKGLAESLALLGSHPETLTNCSFNKAEATANLVVREVLLEADWIIWASLNSLLPLLAESAPKEFLQAIEASLRNNPCPFDELFAQEGDGITGRNYMTGLLWALETLAWDELYLIQVTMILGELALHDPGGSWANRPANSLTTIFLPWIPQTIAPAEKRLVAVRTLQKELPEIAWKTVLSLLPSQHQVSTGSYKPLWRNVIPEDWSKGVTRQEYWEQISTYADMAVQMARKDVTKLVKFVEHIDNLPQPAFENFLSYLGSDEVSGMSEEKRLPLWTKLVELVSEHRRSADAKWALNPELVEKIDRVAKRLTPQKITNRYRILFSESNFGLYEEKGNWEEQQKKLEQRRQDAIQEILENNGIAEVIEFAEFVESPWRVGLSLGLIAAEQADSVILPELLEIKNEKLAQFANGFIWGRYQNHSWTWIDKIDTSDWSSEQIGQFLAYLPFISETWQVSQTLLGQNDAAYWKKVSVNPCQAEVDLSLAINKLLEHGRPNAAIKCLYSMLHNNQPLDKSRAVKALLEAVTSKEPSYSMDKYDTIEIIKALQDDPNTNPEDLFQVEWAYLPLLDGYHDASPKYLEQRLASEPEFFCQVIRTVFRSKKSKQSEEEPTEQQKKIAMNAYRLFDEWKTPPGKHVDGSFSGTTFNHWLDEVKASCEASGHLEVALSQIGNVLIHTPPDPEGLWIHRSVAEALNAKDVEEMRNGFCIGLFNLQGVHWGDPNGKTEKELAEKYGNQAEEVEAHGYYRLSASLRKLADSFTRNAERILEEHKIRGESEA